MSTIISVENISKLYHISTRGTADAETLVAQSSLRDSISSLMRRSRPGRKVKTHSEELWSLKNVSFDVKQGEVVGLIGRNGAGKSTLLKILSRITEPTSGSLKLYGNVGSLLEVGTGFHPELTGRENVFLNGAILGMKRGEIARKFDEIIAFSELEKFVDTPVKYYSSGMYTRLAFAVAAHLEPQILIIDEVLAVGDATFQKKCLGKMDDAAREGRTVIYVSHNLPSVTALCNRAIYLSSGQIVQDGPAVDVVNSYLQDCRVGPRPTAEWHSNGRTASTKDISLESVRILNSRNSLNGSFDMDEPIRIEVTYSVLRSQVETHVGYHLYNASGVLVFVAADFHDAEWLDRPKQAATYRSVCEIPGKFLNMGNYVLDIAISKAGNQGAEIFEKELVAFELHESAQTEVRGRYTGEWQIGVMRPKLDWKTTRET